MQAALEPAEPVLNASATIETAELPALPVEAALDASSPKQTPETVADGTPHPVDPASAAPAPWSRATPIEREVVDTAGAHAMSDGLEDEIRAAIETAELDTEAAAQHARVVAMPPVRSEGDAEPAKASAPAITIASSSAPEKSGLAIEVDRPLTPIIIPPVEPTAPVAAPVWTSAPGALLTNVLEEWAAGEGWTIFNQSGAIWKVTVPFSYQGAFEDAAIELISGFSHANPRPQATVYPNKTIVIRRFDNRKASNDN